MVYNGILMEAIGISVMGSIGLLLFFFVFLKNSIKILSRSSEPSVCILSHIVS